MMKLGRGLIAREREGWLSAYCAGLSRCPTVAKFDKMIAHQHEKLVDLDLIILPTGWWQPDYANIWKDHKSRPAIIAVSDYQRDTQPFIMDCVVSLANCDDCLPCDYDIDEVAARIEAIRRRVVFNAPLTSKVAGLNGRVLIDLCESSIQVDGVDHTEKFTPMERALVKALANKPGWCISKDVLCETIMSVEKMETLADCLKHIDVYVCRIRRKLGSLGIPGRKIIGTFWGRGYVFDVPTPEIPPNPWYRRRREAARQLEPVA